MSNNVAKRLKILRNIGKFSQKEFADYLGVSTRSYERWEQGVNVPDLNNLIKIADKIDISLDFLVGRADVSVTVTNYKNIKLKYKGG